MIAKPTHSVAVIGGGPVGLSSSILLSLCGVENVLFERYPSTSIHPKAVGINQRTTEIFRLMGIEDEIYRHAAPPEVSGRTAWYTSLGPEGREIISRDAWGGGQYEEEYKTHSPSRYCILPQIRLEPILKKRATELNPTGIQYGSEVTKLEQDESGVTLTVKKDNVSSEIKARYAIIADGGRMFTSSLGIEWIGHQDLFRMVTAHINAPIYRRHPDPRNFITWFSSPELGGSVKTGVLYQIGPWPAKAEQEEWVFACALTPADPERFDRETMIERLHRTLQIPDLPVEILSFSHWNVNCKYAEKYRTRNCFLVGDSAHKIPPWGALGVNTGIQDTRNLVWKLCLALQDEGKYGALLDTYETERQPIGERVGSWSLSNCTSHADVIDVALGLSPSQSIEENKKNIASAFDPQHPEHKKKRDAIWKAQKILDAEFKAPGIEIGWFYPSVDSKGEGGSIHDGQLLPDGSQNYEYYVPTTIPGHTVPHAWLRNGSTVRSTFDLVPMDRLVLFVTRPSVWGKARDDRVRLEFIGDDGWIDLDGVWARRKGVDDDGAVLVRPDGIVAWRGTPEQTGPEGFKKLIDKILCCSVLNGDPTAEA